MATRQGSTAISRGLTQMASNQQDRLVLSLQRAYGNQAVQRLIQSVQRTPEATSEGDADVLKWPIADKLQVALKRAISHLPHEAGEQLRQLVAPQSLAIVGGTVAIWGASHVFGAGEIIDVVLGIVGITLLGSEALRAGKELSAFVLGIHSAARMESLDEAGQHLATAVSIIGVDAVVALLLHRAGASERQSNSSEPASSPGESAISENSAPRPSASDPGQVRKGPIPDEVPADLLEQGALAEARSGRGHEKVMQLKDTPRLVDNYGPGEWVKMEHTHEYGDGSKVTIHWFRNKTTGANKEFKFKVGRVLNPTDARRRSF